MALLDNSLDLTYISLGVLAGLVAFYLALGVFSDLLRQRRRIRQEGARVERLTEYAVEKEESVANRLSKSFGAFLNKPRFYFYMDKPTIESLYNDIAPSIRTVEIEEQIAKDTQKGIRGGVSGLGGSYESKSGRSQSEKKQPVDTIESKYDMIVRYLLENQQAKLGLEDFSFDSRWERNYLQACEEVKLKTGSEIPQPVREQAIALNRRISGDEKLGEMRAAQGYALIKGKVLIVRELSGFLLSYRHPVSEAVSADIRINTACTENLTPPGLEMFPTIPDIQVAMLVRIVGMTGNILSVKPLVIHGAS